MLCAGIDAGSRAVKVVLIDADTGRPAASAVCDQGVHHATVADELLSRALEDAGAGRDDLARIVATGYAREKVAHDTTITEITCHARGVHYLMPSVRTVVEVGGQDSKLLKLDGGVVRDFAMNDRCAAGTGRFLEMVADRLEVSLEGLGELARGSRSPAEISSMCVVFAESEIIGLLASGAAPEDIAAGVQAAIASRVASMAGRPTAAPVAFTGGVAMVQGMSDALAAAMESAVTVAPNPQMTGALGAAILAREQVNAESRHGERSKP